MTPLASTRTPLNAALARPLGAAAWALLQALPVGASPGAAPGPLDCMIQPHQIVQVGAPAAGVVERILVERGDTVERGQVLVQMQADVERAALALAQERSLQTGEVRSAASARSFAERELQRARELADDKFVSPTYVDRVRAEAEVAGGRIEQAQERQRMASRELQLAQAQLALRTIRSPISGVVVDRYLSVGEYVEQKPVLRVATIDPLRVDVLVPATAFGRVRVGMTGRVMPELAHLGAHEAVVKSVDRVIDAASSSFRVRLELPNPQGALPAGLRCKVDLPLVPGGTDTQAARPAPPAAAAAPLVQGAAALRPVSTAAPR